MSTLLSTRWLSNIQSSLTLWLVFASFALSVCARAQSTAELCPRPAAASVTTAAPELRSSSGSLEVTLNFKSDVDSFGITRYCYVTDTGLLSPTLRVLPGDTLTIHLRNALSSAVPGSALMHMSMHPQDTASDDCSGNGMTAASTNLHFHGLNLAPTCHQDEVIHTLVQPGQTFDYQLQIPLNEPPGLYWYHPHAHGLSDMQVSGGATGAIIVDGIQDLVPALAGMTDRTFLLRDQPIPEANLNASDVDQPSWDISLNFTPILYPAYQAAVIQSSEGGQEFWRLVNSAADTIFNLQVLSNGEPQPVQVYAIDGVPVTGGPIPESTLFLPPGSRVEFVLATPTAGSSFQLITTRWDAGPAGDSAPPRTIANIVPLASSSTQARLAQKEWSRLPAAKTSARPAPRFSGLASAAPTQSRTLFFSEEGSDDGIANGAFFITVDGQDPEVFSMGQPPNIITHAGTVEDWTIQNRSTEDHIFHMHQIHFQVLECERRLRLRSRDPRHHARRPLQWNRPIPQHQGAHGLPRSWLGRKLCLSLSHSRSRRPRHDGSHPGPAPSDCDQHGAVSRPCECSTEHLDLRGCRRHSVASGRCKRNRVCHI